MPNNFVKCSVLKCKNSMRFRFPKNKDRKEKWLKAIARPDFIPKDSQGLCIDHFDPKDIQMGIEGLYMLERVRLRQGTVPTIFPWTSVDYEDSSKTSNHDSSRIDSTVFSEKVIPDDTSNQLTTLTVPDIQQKKLIEEESSISIKQELCDDHESRVVSAEVISNGVKSEPSGDCYNEEISNNFVSDELNGNRVKSEPSVDCYDGEIINFVCVNAIKQEMY